MWQPYHRHIIFFSLLLSPLLTALPASGLQQLRRRVTPPISSSSLPLSLPLCRCHQPSLQLHHPCVLFLQICVWVQELCVFSASCCSMGGGTTRWGYVVCRWDAGLLWRWLERAGVVLMLTAAKRLRWEHWCCRQQVEDVFVGRRPPSFLLFSPDLRISRAAVVPPPAAATPRNNIDAVQEQQHLGIWQ